MLTGSQNTIEAMFKQFSFLKSIRFSHYGGLTIRFKRKGIKYCEFFETLLLAQEFLESEAKSSTDEV